MPEKTYKINFYTGYIGREDNDDKVSDIFRELTKKDPCPPCTIDDYTYEIRELRAFGNGSFNGILAKFRSDDIPHIGAPGGEERDIEMEEGEALIEKNHFIFYQDYELLVFQSNRNGSSTRALSTYLGDYKNDTVRFAPVLQLDPMRRLLHSEAKPRKIELSFARPSKDWIKRNHTQFSNGIIKLLSEAGGSRINLTITPPRKSFLHMGMKEVVRNLLEEVPEDVKVARMNVLEGDVEHPIDLIADRLFSKKTVDMNGRYPNTKGMFRALQEALDDHSITLRKIFGN